MTRNTIISSIATLLCFCCLLTAKGQPTHGYTEEHPLVIVCDRDFPPYEFKNDQGEPDGYNVELLNLILSRLNIPHKFVMKKWGETLKIFNNHEADLVHAPAAVYRREPYTMTQNMISYYPIKSVRRKDKKPLMKISQLGPEDTVMVKENDYAAFRLQRDHSTKINVEYHSPEDALMSIRNGKNAYFIWGAVPLRQKIKEYGLDSLIIDNIDLPPGELRIIGYDKKLVESIDDIYARLEQSGDLQAIYDRWFYPERVHNDSSPVGLFLTIGALIAIITIVRLCRFIRMRIATLSSRTTDINNMMSQALKMGNYYVIEYDLAAKHYFNVYGDLLPEEGLSDSEFLTRFPSEYQSVLKHRVEEIIAKEETEIRTINWRMNLGTEAKPEWHYLQGNATTEKENGKIRLLYSMKDINRQMEEELFSSETGNQYMRMFETNLIAMSFYNKEGVLLDINESMKRLCGYDNPNEHLFQTLNMFEMSTIKDKYEKGSKENFHVCQHVQRPENGFDKYLEIKIRPTFDEQGELQFYIVTGRDVTAERDIYVKQHKHDLELLKASKIINMRETQLNYLLENGQMFIWNYYPENEMIHFTRSIHKQEYKETLQEFFTGIDGESCQEVLDKIRKCVAEGQPYNVIHHYNYTPVEKMPVWYSICGIPIHDKDGKISHYFGISRNITKLMEVQQKLKSETARAEDSGKMKSAFLANMTHEIRTPLNAIVGFSGLLPVVDTAEERMEFIRIIRSNCDMLMRLINDILAASNMEQALTIVPAEMDFARAFDDICQSLAQRVQESGVEFIKDNPYEHYKTIIDKGRIQQVLTNFTTNAVKYTQQGHIKVGYRYERRMAKDNSGEADGLYFYCEDTGAGIPKEKQACIFERFVKLNDYVQGTGLGLSICQAIADHCNGHIGVTSEGEGHGSTFWMWIPCEKK